ncbi:hypothetical protein CEXT_71791 [Caerostris extrusa]|uniref:Uncharacterized protein n=1 Tax=Caerostris extrusa TaxID=172846 RepID=A0AAV4TD84_CAEEX|nr:hypothetical protein CEXT_71791 [Caerostris extrusa]
MTTEKKKNREKSHKKAELGRTKNRCPINLSSEALVNGRRRKRPGDGLMKMFRTFSWKLSGSKSNKEPGTQSCPFFSSFCREDAARAVVFESDILRKWNFSSSPSSA